MQPDLLQQLRDIHLPATPGWWPPAVGWWLLAVAVLVACGYLFHRLYRSYQHRRPIKRARRLYDVLHTRLQAGEIPVETYLHESNELLKRLLIHGLGVRAARPASAGVWLSLLDEYHGSTQFSRGPGQILGNERFRRAPTVDPQALHALIVSFMRKVRP
jgi:hypothetical protein